MSAESAAAAPGRGGGAGARGAGTRALHQAQEAQAAARQLQTFTLCTTNLLSAQPPLNTVITVSIIFSVKV